MVDSAGVAQQMKSLRNLIVGALIIFSFGVNGQVLRKRSVTIKPYQKSWGFLVNRKANTARTENNEEHLKNMPDSMALQIDVRTDSLTGNLHQFTCGLSDTLGRSIDKLAYQELDYFSQVSNVQTDGGGESGEIGFSTKLGMVDGLSHGVEKLDPTSGIASQLLPASNVIESGIKELEIVNTNLPNVNIEPLLTQISTPSDLGWLPQLPLPSLLTNLEAAGNLVEQQVVNLEVLSEMQGEIGQAEGLSQMAGNLGDKNSAKELLSQKVRKQAVNHFAGKEEHLQRAMETLTSALVGVLHQQESLDRSLSHPASPVVRFERWQICSLPSAMITGSHCV